MDKSWKAWARYKATFLVLADRDTVGSKGQNKGFAKGSFFAIDPGHSLEGNGKDLQIEDNLSFKDTHGFALTSRFANYSVFDDDTRFAKFQGALGLRTLKESGKIEKLFDDYRKAFDPRESGIPPEEKVLRNKIQAEIDSYKTGGPHAALFPDRWLPAAVVICDEPFTIANQMMNSTMKIVRRKVEEHYADRIAYSYTAEGKDLHNEKNIASL